MKPTPRTPGRRFPVPRSGLLGVVLAGALALPAAAQCQAAITTDRPGLSFSPTTVPAGRVQAEVGAPRLDYAGDGDDPAIGIDAALRWGIAPRLEARVSTSWYGRTSGDGLVAGPTGIAGVRAGAKLQVLSTPRVNLSVIPEVVLPIGNQALAGDRSAWSVNGAAGVGMGATTLVLVGGAQWNPVGDDGHQATGLLVALLGRSFTGTLGGYLELGTLPRQGADASYAGGGLVGLINSGTQVDAFVDLGVSAAASNIVFGVGLSFLLHRETARDDHALLDRPAAHAGPVRLPARGAAQAGAVLK